MSNSTNYDTLNEKTIQDNSCIICLGSFGIQDQRIPYQCTKEKCKKNYCGHCMDTIKKCNGSKRQFQCMYCLFKYPLGTTVPVNELFLDELWKRAYIKYGFQQQSTNSVRKPMSQQDFQFELECRYYHITHLSGTLKLFDHWDTIESAFETGNHADGTIAKMYKILLEIRNNKNADIPFLQNEYNRIITSPNRLNGSFYINICERLIFEIEHAELRCLFPETYDKSIQWSCTLGSGDEFQPKIPELFNAIQNDIRKLPSNTFHTTLRTKIGFIGYTSTGKTTLMYRLLGIDESERDYFLPVHTTKSTYYPLQYNRVKPFTHPGDSRVTTFVKFIDIQGCDQGHLISNRNFQPGNYFDEIRKADCDVYVLVHDRELTDEQHRWIHFIENLMQRKCILVRSKVDEVFLNRFLELYGIPYAMSSENERSQRSLDTINDLKRHLAIDGHDIFLTAANYRPNSSDTIFLLKNHSFDFQLLLNELSRFTHSAQNSRLNNLAVRAAQRVINSCFRCGYILNVMKYKISTGIAAIIPFGDSIPRYFAREGIKEAFGITEEFLESLRRHNLQIFDGQLRTSIFIQYMQISGEELSSSHNDLIHIGSLQPAGIMAIGGTLADDIIRVGVPALSTLSNGARLALGVATFGVGIVISAGVCAWSAHNAGNHIFGYANRLCDDLILLTIPLVKSYREERPSAPIV